MVYGGISIRAIKLIIAILGLSMLLIAYGSATDHGASSQFGKAYYEGQSGHGHDNGNLNLIDHGWNDKEHDWLSPGGYYYSYPTAYYYNCYSTPHYSYTYYPTYSYYYTEPAYTSLGYHDWDLYPWWGTNVYGFGTIYYHSGSHWAYMSGFGAA